MVPGPISEKQAIAVGFAATLFIAAVDLHVTPSVPLNLFYLFPVALIAIYARSTVVVLLAAALSLLLQAYVLTSYGLSSLAFAADTLMVAVACAATVAAVRALRQGFFRARATAGNATLAAALQSMTDAVFISDADGNFTASNEACVGFHRLKSSAECPTSIAAYAGIFDVMTPDGEPLPSERSATVRALRGENVVNSDYMLRRKSTGETWVGSYSAAPIRDERGMIIGAVVTARDVTGQRLADQRLRHAYELLAMAERSAMAGSWTWDIASDTLDWSPEMFRLYGREPQPGSASFATWQAALHPEDAADAVRLVRDSIAQHVPLTTTYRIIRPNGDVRWIDAVGTTSYDAQGEALRMSGICIDVTRRRAAEDELRQTQSDYRAFFENVSIGAAQIDTSGHFLDVNPRFCEMTGYARDELLGKMTPLDLSSPEDRQVLGDRMSRAFDGVERFYHAEHRMLRKDGTFRWIDITVSPIRDESGQVRKMGVLAADITTRRSAELQLRESEASLRAFFDNAAVGAIQLDDEGRYIRVNLAYCAILGYAGDELTGRMSLTDTDAPEFKGVEQAALERLLGGADRQVTLEKQVIRKDGTRRWVRVAASVVEQDGSASRRISALVTDITAGKEAEARVLESRDQLQQLNLSLEGEVRSRTASLVEANRQLGILARMDALTGIANRLSANERLRQDYMFMKRTKLPYAVLMIDIDHFKAVNDSCGHEAGDRVLREVAQRLRKELRESDFISRFGGEEFLAVLQIGRAHV